MTLRKKKLLISGALALLLVSAGLSVLPGRTALRQRLEAEASAALGMRVTIGGRIGVAFFPGALISLRDVTAKGPGLTAVEIKKVKLWLALKPLLKREVLIDRVDLISPSLHLARRRPGEGFPEKPAARSAKKPFNLRELRVTGGSLTYAGPGDASGVEAGGIELTVSELHYGGVPGEAPGRELFLKGKGKCRTFRGGSKVQADGIELTAAELSYIGLNAGKPYTALSFKGGIKCGTFKAGGGTEASSVEAAAEDLSYISPAAGNRKITFKGGVLCKTLTAGDKALAVDLELSEGDLFYTFKGGEKPRKNLAGKGNIKCGAFRTGNLSFTGIKMKAAAEKGVFSAADMRMDFLGGVGSGGLKIDLGSESPAYEADYTVSGSRMEEYLSAFSRGKAAEREPLEGPADLSVELKVRGNNLDALLRSMNGRFSLTGKDLTLHNMDLDMVISKLERSQNFNLLDAGAFLLAGPLGPALTKSYNFADVGFSRGKDGKIGRLVSAWKVENGIARAEDVALATLNHRLAVKGRLDFIGLRFEEMTVAVLDKRGCAVYSQKVNGTLARPELGKLSMLESLAGPVLSVFGTVKRLVPGMECSPFYSGSVPQPGKD